MQTCADSPAPTRIRPRTALLASADGSFRRRLNDILTGLHWQVREAQGGADAWTQATAVPPEAVIVDSWLPDLDCSEFLREFRFSFPEVALLKSDGTFSEMSAQGQHRQELLFALQRSREFDGAAWISAPNLSKGQEDKVDVEALVLPLDHSERPSANCLAPGKASVTRFKSAPA